MPTLPCCQWSLADGTSCGSLCQCLTTPSEDFLTPHINFPYFSLKPPHLVLSPSNHVKSHFSSCIEAPFTYWMDLCICWSCLQGSSALPTAYRQNFKTLPGLIAFRKRCVVGEQDAEMVAVLMVCVCWCKLQ